MQQRSRSYESAASIAFTVWLGVEGYSYGRMPQHLRDDLRVHILKQQYGSGGVPQLVNVIFGNPARCRSGVRDRLRKFVGLMSVPLLVQKTRPFSCQLSPVLSLSTSCHARWFCNAFVAFLVSLTVRLP